MNSALSSIKEHDISFRVRYSETDAQGFVHHAAYFHYFEMGRIELLRAQGIDYKKIEEGGHFLVVAHLECDYKHSAKFDDELILRTKLSKAGKASLEHTYELIHQEKIITTAKTVIACVNRDGKVTSLRNVLTGLS